MIAALLQRLLETVARGCPAAWTALTAQPMRLSARIGDERFCVIVDGAGARVTGGEQDLSLTCSADTVRALLLGDDDVIAALHDERLQLFGGVQDLLRLDDFVRLLVAGAARAPGTGALLDEFLALEGA